MTKAVVRAVLATVVVWSATAIVSHAQQTATSSETKTFEVLAVEGNTLVVRLPEGTRELTVADDFRFTIDGQQLSVRQLKPGMKGTATITTRTTTTPVTVTEVKNGTVVMQTGTSIIVRTDEGLKSFTQGDIDRRGVKIIRNGQPAQVSDFRDGDRLSATIITSLPPKIVTEKEVQATLAAAKTSAPRPAPAAKAATPSTTTAAATSTGQASGAAEDIAEDGHCAADARARQRPCACGRIGPDGQAAVCELARAAGPSRHACAMRSAFRRPVAARSSTHAPP